MRATLTDEQLQLSEVAADLARAARPEAPAAGERLPEDGDASASLFGGFAGLAVPEDVGGSGGGLLDLALVVHELGRNLVPTPFIEHVLALQVAHGAGLDTTAALGGARWVLATDESGAPALGPWQAGSGDTVKRRVAYADGADAVVATTGSDGVVIASIDGFEPDASTDLARTTGSVTLGDSTQQTDVGASAGLRRALTLLGAEAVGVGRGAIELAVEYAKQREQFGTPIGKFQGVAHQLADALVAVENAWSLVLYAAWAVDADDPGAARSVHAAKASASEAAVFAAERSTQVHGGIGITWEAMPHLYLRRAITMSTRLGDANAHRLLLGNSLVA